MLLPFWLARCKEAAQETPLREERALGGGNRSKTDTGDPRKSQRMRFNDVLVLKMPQLYYTANRVMHNPADSEDAVQDGLLAAFLHIDQFRGESRMSTWLHSIVRNAALMQLRKKSRLRETSIPEGAEGEQPDYDALFIDSSFGPEELCARAERTRLLAEKLKYLSPHCRSAVQLCVIEGLLLREAAKKLGISAGAVKARLHRARRILAQRA